MNRRTFCLSVSAALLGACRPPRDEPAAAAIGGPFSLVDQDGRPVTEAVLQGRWSAIYFGFTYCPDVCPTSLMALKEGLDKLGRRGEQVQSILISVDPDRDTPEAMKAYLDNSAFPDGIIGLTGSPAQVEHVAKAYKIYFRKDGEGPDYLVQHQSIIYVMDPRGRFARALTHDLSPDQIAEQIGDAMRQRV